MIQTFDIVINGGGMVGLALACGLQKIGFRVAIIECQRKEEIFDKNRAVFRFSAINEASRHFLKYIQVWETITEQYDNPYRGIEVWERDQCGYIVFDATKMGYCELGHIIENRVIQQELWRHVEKLNEITLISPAKIYKVIWCEQEVLITLEDNRMLSGRLIVAADGANSLVRTYANISITCWDYCHHALVATVRTTQPHRNIARQTFHSHGILAFLPLREPNLSSIVWSLPPLIAQDRLIASAKDFNSSLSIHFSLTLGLCELQSERKIFPLTGLYAHNFAAHRLVLVGDAAHTVHPLAGQGVNLGFLDIAELLGELENLQKTGMDIGHYPNLRRYERTRKYSAALILSGMQCLRELFAGNNLLKIYLRNVSLKVINRIPGIKLCLIKQAMGLNDVPPWLLDKFFK